MDEKLLKREERAVFALRSLYRRYGYLPFKMSKFEEYELYARNKDFLMSDRVITFTDTNGRLMALKPDVTLSIVKKGEDRPGVKQKLCYDESVYRPSGSTGQYKEITQTGLECIGDVDGYDVYEVVSLAVESLRLVSESFVLELNHLGLLTALLDAISPDAQLRRLLARCVAGKNRHDLRRIAAENDLPEAATETLCTCAGVYGELGAALEALEPLCSGEAAQKALDELKALYALLRANGQAAHAVFDFSLVSDVQYYNGIVFRGYLPGLAESVLSGGQYDRLLRRMGRRSRAVGFALYLDRLEELGGEERAWDVDVLLLYDASVPPERVSAAVRAFAEEDKSVSAQKAVPDRLRYRELCDLRGEGQT